MAGTDFDNAIALARAIIQRDARGTQPIPLSHGEALLLATVLWDITKERRAVGTDDPHDVEGDSLVGAVLDDREGDALPYLRHVLPVAKCDAAHILETDPIYGGSWQKRGGVGAMMMLARKWDRLEERVRNVGWDIFRAITEDTRREGVIDDARDLRRYLTLVEAKAISDGRVLLQRTSKDSSR